VLPASSFPSASKRAEMGATLWCALLWVEALVCGVEFDTGEITVHSWVSNPVARHTACKVGANTPTVCTLVGSDELNRPLEYYIQTLPTNGLLYDTSPNFRTYGTDPKYLPDPIGPHQLPFHVTDPHRRVVYLPPANQWPPENFWTSFTFIVVMTPPLPEGLVVGPGVPAPSPVTSEPGLAVMANPEGQIAGSNFDVTASGDGWSITGNLVDKSVTSGGLKHQAFVLGGLSHYVYGVDDVQYLDFATGLDRTRWYFEASPASYHLPELASAFGGRLRFIVRALYGNFTELNSPLDWITIECAACDSGLGMRIVRFVDESLWWDGSERVVDVLLHPVERWQRDPLNSALDFADATECEIAAVLTSISRVAVLGDFARGGEGVAIDDFSITMADAGLQPAYPVVCQKGCTCRHNSDIVRPTCC